jgi:hypothetical protein
MTSNADFYSDRPSNEFPPSPRLHYDIGEHQVPRIERNPVSPLVARAKEAGHQDVRETYRRVEEE